MRIEQVRIKNFKMFRDVTVKGLQPFTVLVGANGSGKTTFFDVFGFLRDCLTGNVRTALARRGGFKEVVTRGHDREAISIELKINIKLDVGDRLVTYLIDIAQPADRPIVTHELLRYTRYSGGQPFKFIDFVNGAGRAIKNELEIVPGGEEQREEQRLDAPDILAIKGLGQFQRFAAASAIRNLIENWHVSDFRIDAARLSPEAGVAEHLSTEGDNLALVAQHMYENHRALFDRVLDVMRRRVPGVENVTARQSETGQIILRFKDGAFADPFVAKFVSDGTIKMFAYLILLHDPDTHPLLCVEEPENQLYPNLMGELAEEFEDYARRGGQVFVSTHSPDFLNAVKPASLFVLTKSQGYTNITNARQFANVETLVEQGDKLGELWRQRMFHGADPQ